jgi:ABC-type phosphate transport system auxiliary subunit
MLQPINIELYQFLEERLGKEEARKVAEVIERSFEAIEKKAEEVALQKKLEIKDELTKELATKADIARLEGEVKADIARLEGEIQTFKADFEGKISSLKTDLEGKIYNLKTDLEGKIYNLKTDLEGKISALKTDLEGRISVLRMEFRVYFVILIAVIILSSPRAVDLIGKILGVVK